MNPQDRQYTQEHEWVQIQDGIATVGLTAYARKALGEVVFIQLPKVDTVVVRDEPIGEVESTKSVTDIYGPVAGVVIEANTELEANPYILNEDPWARGWLIKIRVDEAGEGAVLMDADTYTSLTEQ